MLLVVLAISIAHTAVPQTSVLNNLKKQQQEAEAEVARTNKKLSTAQKNTRKSLAALAQVDAEIREQKKAIQQIKNEIYRLNRQEREFNDQIYLLTLDIQAKKRDYAKAIQSISRKNSGYNVLVFLFSANSFSQTIRRVRYLKEFSAWRKNQVEEIKERQAELEEARQKLIALKENRTKKLATLNTEKKVLDSKQQDQKKVIDKLKTQETAISRELKRQQKLARELDSKIEQMITEEARQSNNITSKTKQPKGEYSNFKMTKEQEKLAASFEKNKGKLPMPLSGRYLIVSRFGKQQHQQLKYVQVNNSGITIKTEPGTKARSVFKGEVTKVFVIPGYNSSVIVRHGNYLTIYTNLKEVYVKPGDKVETGDELGKIFTDTADGNLTQLQFQLWKETTKLNPELWLNN